MTVKRYIVDASVAARWYFPESLAEHADALLQQRSEILAPDILPVELAQLVWKRARSGEIDEAMAHRIVAELRRVPLELKPTSELVSAALPLALHHGLTLIDAFYIALAMQSGCLFVTADRWLYDTLRAGPLAEHALWLGDLA
ncbi:MAG TPA: type II toxin-antitoxin system VapC family toxin [Thermoanaerobaculia bacterium]|jgi:predicted nucleic acid-binding protein|nr:type II toxin-antitoxin system VapC family toxin [Thermoanaerobaculia bacterium]